MTIVEKIREDIKDSVLCKNEIRKSILRLLLGEIDTCQARGQVVDDNKIYAIINKIISSNEETFKVKKDDTLMKENAILIEYLPKYLTLEELQSLFSDKKELALIKECDNDGKAIGLAVKYAKENNIPVTSNVVREFVLKVRNNGN